MPTPFTLTPHAPKHCSVFDIIGYTERWLNPFDPKTAAEQLDFNYQHGGGWRPMKGWSLEPGNRNLSYPGDPPLPLLAYGKLRDEVIYVYAHAWFCIVQPDGSFEVARMD